MSGLSGGCYCGEIQYNSAGDVAMKIQCHCRECQYFTGGNTGFTMVVPDAGFQYTKGTPEAFSRDDLPAAVTREFCANCGTQIIARAQSLTGMVILKVGTLDDPSVFEGPKLAIYTKDRQPFHMTCEGIPQFETVPSRK